MLSNRHESTRVERLVTTNDDPSYRMSISKTLRLPVVSRFKNMGAPCLLLQIDIRYDRSSFADWSNRVESSTFATLFSL